MAGDKPSTLRFLRESRIGAPNGVAGTGPDGKILTAQMPALRTADSYPVTTEAAMLALPADRGDMAIRSDIRTTFVLFAEPASILSNWIEVLTPYDGVLSINGRSGAEITGLAEQADVTAALAGKASLVHTHAQADVTGLTTALADARTYVDSKQALNYGVRATSTITSASGLTPDPLTYFEYEYTALAVNLNVSNPIAPPNGTAFQIIIKDDGTARALAWGTSFYGLTAALPSTTVAGKILLLVFRYSTSRARWELQTLRQEV